MAALTAELLAYVCGGHHGLFDCMDAANGFPHRATDEKIEYEDVKRNYLSDLAHRSNVLFTQAEQEIEAIVDTIVSMCESRAQDEPEFYTGLLARLLLSAVMEGDRRDTAEFMRNVRYPDFNDDAAREKLWFRSIEYMERELERKLDLSKSRK